MDHSVYLEDLSDTVEHQHFSTKALDNEKMVPLDC